MLVRKTRPKTVAVKMAFVQLHFIKIIFILGGVRTVESMSLSAVEGDKELKITCSHSNAQGNIKYFCKKLCTDKDVLIKGNGKSLNGKYSLRDEGNTFYVNISDLSLDDSGIYWCGVDRVGVDTYSEVVITVTPRTEDSHSDATSQNMLSSTEKLLYLGGGLSALLLMLVTAVVIFIKYRPRDTRKPKEREESSVTLTKPLQTTQNPPQDITISCSSANQSSGPDLNPVQHRTDMSLEPSCAIYSNTQRDSVCYASLHFNKHAVDTDPTATAPEHPIYSELK